MWRQKIKNIHPCWWCGECAMLEADRRTRFHNSDCMGEDVCDIYMVRCGKQHPFCDTRTIRIESKHKEEYSNKIVGVDDPKAEAIALWEAGEVKIPLTVVLPENHYVVERKLLPSPNRFHTPTLTTYEVTRTRGIADHLKRNLAAVIEPGETYRSHTFELRERHAIHTGVKLVSVSLKAFDNMLFVFQIDNTQLNMTQNKVDGAWLKVPNVRPPVWDKTFEILSKDYVEEED